MSNNIEIEVKIDETYKNPKVVIYTDKIDDRVNQLVNKVKNESDNNLLGYKDDEAYILELKKIESIYTENKKVYARSENEIYQVKKRIFELEEMLSYYDFVRISNSEIVNFKKVSSIDFKLAGTILLNFKSKEKTYVSRRYVKKIKEYLDV